MRSRRCLVSFILGATALVAVIGPAAAATPTAIPPSGAAMSGERPLTARERALSDAKVAAAEAYLARARAAGAGLGSLGCVPNITPSGLPAGPGSTTARPTVAAGTCAPASGYLPVEARQQLFDHYCGPAVGQVISNYAWATGSGRNRYTQQVIAGWMKTDVYGQTSAPELAAGLQRATSGGPRHPSRFTWTVTELKDTDRDGTTGDQLHAYLQSAISGWRMPIAIAVKPHEPGVADHLSSWPDPIRSAGHWIAAYGWSGTWGGFPSARTHFADSSEEQGGGTGKYSNLTSTVARMIGDHTGRFVW